MPRLDYAAAGKEIHRRLDKLGLSPNPKNVIYFCDSNSVQSFVYHLENKYVSYEISSTSTRVMIMCWILFGGKLKIKRN